MQKRQKLGIANEDKIIAFEDFRWILRIRGYLFMTRR